ncbi:hypothetical protein SAMN04488061_1011 [Filomicrobium insigne]|uniref:Uncharacterized protein n=1 Tax=Filomicrobium insigne TaxID=418854 RepID=A0A1H0J059_9HYPH|nr:hypothetical protein SAMN04488061_1011 [Filomicrobium insigne]
MHIFALACLARQYCRAISSSTSAYHWGARTCNKRQSKSGPADRRLLWRKRMRYGLA